MQKKVGDVLYVLDLTPYTITEDTDVSIIYVQNEQIKGYKELNTELASKIHGFNQFIMTVLPRPWADGGDEPEPTGHTLMLDGSDIHGHVDVYFNNEQVQTTIEYTDVVAGTEIQIKPEQGASPSWYNVVQGVEWDDNVQAWVATMPDEDYRITMNYNGEPQQQGHTFTLFGSDVHSHVDVYFNDALQEMSASWNNVMPGTSIQIKPKEGYTKEWFGGLQNVEWVDSYNAWFPVYDGNYGMPDVDLTVNIDYIGQPQVETYTLRINAQDFMSNEALYVEGVDNPQFNTDISVPEGVKARIYVNYPNWYSLPYDSAVTAGAGPYTYNGQTYQDYILVFGWAPAESSEAPLVEGTMPAEDYTTDITCSSPTVTITYNVEDITNPVTLFSIAGESNSDFESNGPDAMYVDGVEVLPSDTYTFDTIGNHTVVYIFSDNVLDALFNPNAPVTSVVVGAGIYDIRGICWRIDDNVSNTYLPTTPPTISGDSSEIVVPQTTIYVPAAALQDYYQAEHWSDISNQIQEIPGSGESGESGVS